MSSNPGATSGGGVLGGGTHLKLIVGLRSLGFVSFLLCFLGLFIHVHSIVALQYLSV